MAHLLKITLGILRLKQVEKKVGLKSSSIYQKISEGTFPSQVRLGARAVGWIESEIEEWIAAQVQKSRTVPGGAIIPTETIARTEEIDAMSTFLRDERLPQPLSPTKPQIPPASSRAESPPGSTIALSKKGGRSHE
jgi:prophage regulatory protein